MLLDKTGIVSFHVEAVMESNNLNLLKATRKMVNVQATLQPACRREIQQGFSVQARMNG